MLAPVAAVGAWWCLDQLRYGPGRGRARALRPNRPRLGRWRVPVADALAALGVGLAPERALLGWWAAVGSAALCAPVVGRPTAAMGALGLTAAGPVAVVVLRRRPDRRRGPALIEWLDAVVAELRAGAVLPTAIERAAVPAPLARELDRLRARDLAGGSLLDACRRWADERPDPDTRAVVGACCVAFAVGGPAAEGLAGLAGSLRARAEVRAEAAGLATQARLSALVIALAPVAFLLVAGAGDPRLVTGLVGTAPGRVCLALGLGLDAIGVWWMRRIVAGVG